MAENQGKRATSNRRSETLASPMVPPETYDEGYYTTHSAGHPEWSASGGAEVWAAYPTFLEMAGLRSGEVLVDIGTGRGELLAVAVERGAARAIGVDYAPDAVRLARRTIEVHNVGDRASALLADARAIPLDDQQADVVTLLEVVEHLAPPELARTLSEAYRILKPGGRLFVHTFPNRTVYAVTYRLQRALRVHRRRQWSANPRNDYERRMHVNEQTLTSLRRALRRAGFSPARVWLGEWIHTEFVPDERARKLYHRLASRRPTARFGIANLFAEGCRPA